MKNKTNKQKSIMLKCDKCFKLFKLGKKDVKTRSVYLEDVGISKLSYFKCRHCGEVYFAKVENEENLKISKKRKRIAIKIAQYASAKAMNQLEDEEYIKIVDELKKQDKELDLKYKEISSKIKLAVKENGLPL